MLVVKRAFEFLVGLMQLLPTRIQFKAIAVLQCESKNIIFRYRFGALSKTVCLGHQIFRLQKQLQRLVHNLTPIKIMRQE